MRATPLLLLLAFSGLGAVACHASEHAAAPAEEPQVPIRTADDVAAEADAGESANPIPEMTGRHDLLKCKDPDVSKCTTVMPDPNPGSARVRHVVLKRTP